MRYDIGKLIKFPIAALEFKGILLEFSRVIPQLFLLLAQFCLNFKPPRDVT